MPQGVTQSERNPSKLTDIGMGLVAATAHYRNGILLGPLTGEAVAEIVLRTGTPEGRAALGMLDRIGALTRGTVAS